VATVHNANPPSKSTVSSELTILNSMSSQRHGTICALHSTHSQRKHSLERLKLANVFYFWCRCVIIVVCADYLNKCSRETVCNTIQTPCYFSIIPLSSANDKSDLLPFSISTIYPTLLSRIHAMRLVHNALM